MPEAPARLSTTIGWPSTRAATTHNARLPRPPGPPPRPGHIKPTPHPPAHRAPGLVAAPAGSPGADEADRTLGPALRAQGAGRDCERRSAQRSAHESAAPVVGGVHVSCLLVSPPLPWFLGLWGDSHFDAGGR